MTAGIIDGRKVAEEVRDETAAGVARFLEQHGRPPGLSTILVGEDPASQVYIRGKHKACREIGIRSFHHELASTSTGAELLALLEQLRWDEEVDGILVQLPLPAHIDASSMLLAVPPDKDVDGFHPFNVGLLAAGEAALPQCTPAGVVRLLDAYDVPLEGADVTIVGRSNLVGKPLALMLLARNATVTMTHSRTRDLAAHTRNADIVVMAVGKPGLLRADMVRDGAVVIDVGVNRGDEGLLGDVAYDEVAAKASLITPVPGGVGPMTIAMLMQNTLRAAMARAAAAGNA